MPITSGLINSKYMSGLPVVGVSAPSLYTFAQPPISAIQTYNARTGQLGPRIDMNNMLTNFADEFNRNMARKYGINLPSHSQSTSIPYGNQPVSTQTFSNGKINIALAGPTADVNTAMTILNAHFSKP
jgi:hypothetical protein